MVLFGICSANLIPIPSKASQHFTSAISPALKTQASEDLQKIWLIKLDIAAAKLESVLNDQLSSEVRARISDLQVALTVQEGLPTDAIALATGIILRPELLFSTDLNRVLAHELFHVIHAAVNPGEANWIREGLAQYFEFMVYAKMNYLNVKAAFDEPWIELTTPYDYANPNRALYGRALLYFNFVVRECGGADLFWKIATAGLDASLPAQSPRPYCRSYHASREQFEQAMLINQFTPNDAVSPSGYFIAPMNRIGQPRPMPLKK